jgi:hypothetical protein
MIRTIAALIALVRAGSASRWRIRGRYWRWRTETAFGNYPVKANQKLRAMLDYGAWVDEMNNASRNTTFHNPLARADDPELLNSRQQ